MAVCQIGVYKSQIGVFKVCDTQDGASGRAVPSNNLPVLPRLPRRHDQRPRGDDQVVGPDSAHLLAQRDAQPCHIHRYDPQCQRGICQEVWVQIKRKKSMLKIFCARNIYFIDLYFYT